MDLAYSVPGLGRFRCNVFQQRGTVGLVLRVIPMQIRTIDELGLPPVLKNDRGRRARPRPRHRARPGSGKSTTLAAMIDHINQTRRARHDGRGSDRVPAPRSSVSIINQREVSVDTRVVRAGAPERAAAGSRRHSRRRDARLRDDRDGPAGRGDRPPGVLHAAHARRDRDDQPHHRGLPAAPAEADPAAARERAEGGHLAAPDAHASTERPAPPPSRS